jgi:hypothetical protein
LARRSRADGRADDSPQVANLYRQRTNRWWYTNPSSPCTDAAPANV